jgi:hypothetical protein
MYFFQVNSTEFPGNGIKINLITQKDVVLSVENRYNERINVRQAPRTTSYTFTFPNGEFVTYESDNVFLTDLTKEYMIEKRKAKEYFVKYAKV